jgi:hypothetical protein
MRDLTHQKMMIRLMIRAMRWPLIIGAKIRFKDDQAKTGVSAKTYGAPDHREILIRQNDQASTLIPDHNTAPLERAGFDQEGTQAKSPLFGDPGEGLFRPPRLMNPAAKRRQYASAPGHSQAANASLSIVHPKTRSVALAGLQGGKRTTTGAARPWPGPTGYRHAEARGTPSTPHRPARLPALRSIASR